MWSKNSYKRCKCFFHLSSFIIKVIVTVEIDSVMFTRIIENISFVLSAALTCLFSFLVNAVMYFKLKKIDMVESLKSVE